MKPRYRLSNAYFLFQARENIQKIRPFVESREFDSIVGGWSVNKMIVGRRSPCPFLEPSFSVSESRKRKYLADYRKSPCCHA
jgi:hypothetical protein